MTDERFEIEGYAPESVINALSGSGVGDVTPEEAAEVARGLNAVVAAEIAGGIRGGRAELAAALLAETRSRRAELESVPVPYIAAIVEREDGAREKALLTRVPTDGLDVDGVATACIPADLAPMEVSRRLELLRVVRVVDRGTMAARVVDPAAYIAAAPDFAVMPEGMYLKALEDLCEDRCWGVERQARGSYLVDVRDCLGVKVRIDVSAAMGEPSIADPKTWVAAAAAGVDAALPELEADTGDPNYAMARSLRAEFLKRELPAMIGSAIADARWHSLEPSMVPVQEAAWATVLADGRQAVAECHLTDDEDSPWGFGYYFAGFAYEPDEGRWVEQDGGMLHCYTRADDPDLEQEAICSCGPSPDIERAVKIDYDLLEGIGLWSHEGRELSPDEMGAPARALTPSMAPEEMGRAVDGLQDALVDGDGRLLDGRRGHPAGTEREEMRRDIDRAESRPHDGKRPRP